jgi:hypothetical protein
MTAIDQNESHHFRRHIGFRGRSSAPQYPLCLSSVRDPVLIAQSLWGHQVLSVAAGIAIVCCPSRPAGADIAMSLDKPSARRRNTET